MTHLREWWKSRQARIYQAYHGWGIWFWVLMVGAAWYFGWLDSVRFVSLLSIWALVETKFGAWQGSRAEVKVEQTEEIKAEGEVTVQNANHVDRT